MGRGDEGAGGLLSVSDARDSPFDTRRRSVDVGGLALALGGSSRGEDQMEMGKGWGGWEDSEQSGSSMFVSRCTFLSPSVPILNAILLLNRYAELLSDMYTQTQNAVNQSVLT